MTRVSSTIAPRTRAGPSYGWVVLVVAALAIGRTLASWVDATGSYAAAFYALAVVVTVLAIAAMVVRVPPGAEVAAS